MKKILLILTLFMFISPIHAESTCDENKHKTYMSYTTNITYDNDYSMSSKKFTITLYNVISDVYIIYNGEKYTSDNSDTIVIKNISEGKTVKLSVFANDGCNEALKTITIREPYYNKYIGSKICEKYVDKISYCTAKFTKEETTHDLVEIAIKNYEHNIIQDADKISNQKKDDTFEKIMSFLTNWGIKGLLFFLTCLLSINAYHNKFAKIKHGL